MNKMMQNKCKKLSLNKFWYIDRVARFLLGIFIFTLTLLSYFHNTAWLTVIAATCIYLTINSIFNKCIFHDLLMKIGFMEREDIISTNHEKNRQAKL